ncbi:hypothetical protein RchiOBHm_Chr4g0394681 [Rosa chinensis]|uniref:Uncharacterized protein n=1 Tax=Rosa chinensis TaxID=74649 RepID=A0A2P6QRB1_ROSCH|nr:hypothetical protein RchiOBHm_Chr4g0394681 [Rosa chinensis]
MMTDRKSFVRRRLDGGPSAFESSFQRQHGCGHGSSMQGVRRENRSPKASSFRRSFCNFRRSSGMYEVWKSILSVSSTYWYT